MNEKSQRQKEMKKKRENLYSQIELNKHRPWQRNKVRKDQPRLFK